jgi:radical SAM protein with 4Fe4S-binding SPASM domain
MTRNIHELPNLVKLAADAGLDGIKVSHLVVWDEALRKESLIESSEVCERYFAQAAEEAKQLGIYLDLPKRLSRNCKPDSANPYPPCYAPWHYAMISFEGDVRACCFAPEFTMGNIIEEAFSEIWTSKRYKALRSTVNGKTPPAACRTCEERFRYAISPNEERTYIKLTPRKK